MHRGKTNSRFKREGIREFLPPIVLLRLRTRKYLGNVRLFVCCVIATRLVAVIPKQFISDNLIEKEVCINTHIHENRGPLSYLDVNISRNEPIEAIKVS